MVLVSSEKSLKVAKVAMFGLTVLGAALGVISTDSVSPGGW